MSESILPWISTYLVGIAEEYGADISTIPWFKRKKKVQLVEFLTYNEDDILWARISDKEHLIPVRFSRDAIREYNKLNHIRVTQHKTAIVQITDFRPFFSRIPLIKGRMSTDSFLAIECNSFSVIGSSGEAKFGNPKPLESNSDLREWSEGLKQHGGGGNCLKDRKKVKEEASKAEGNASRTVTLPSEYIAVDTKHPSKQTNRKTIPTIKKNKTPIPTNLQARGIWPIAKKPAFRAPPRDIACLLAVMKVDGDLDSDLAKPQHLQSEASTTHSPKKHHLISALLTPSPQDSNTRHRSRSATPVSTQEWPASSFNTHNGVNKSTPSFPSLNPSISPARPNTQATTTTSPLPPTPAQRHPQIKEQTLPPSSPPLPSQLSVAQEIPLFPTPSISPPTHVRREVSRKVPRPPPPAPPSYLLGEPIVLAPNSDPSLSYSQSQPRSQSQSQSQSQQHSENSQPVILSQLSVLSRVRKDKDPLPPQKLHPSCNGKSLNECNTEDEGDLPENEIFGQYPTSSHPITTCPDYKNENEGDSRTNHSLAVQAPVSQPKEIENVDIDITRGKDRGKDESGKADDIFQTPDSHINGQLSQIIDISRGLEEDDAQIHSDLFGSTISSQLPPLSSPPSSPRAHINSPTKMLTSGVPSKSPTLLNSGSEKLPARTLSMKLPNLNKERSNNAKFKAETALGEVQHDPKAWSAPSFIRLGLSKGKTKNTDVSNKYGKSADLAQSPTSHTLKKSRLLNRTPLDHASATRRTELSHIKEPSLNNLTTVGSRVVLHAPSTHGDQNNDPSKHGALASSAFQLSKQVRDPPKKEDPLTSAGTSTVRLQGNKRAHDVISDGNRVSQEPAGHHAKKKKRLNSERLPQAAMEDDKIHPEVAARDNAMKKINGYSVKLDQIELSGEIPLVSWRTLRDILLRTNQDRSRAG